MSDNDCKDCAFAKDCAVYEPNCICHECLVKMVCMSDCEAYYDRMQELGYEMKQGWAIKKEK